MFTTAQLKGKFNRLRRSWRLLNNILTRETGWGWDSERSTITNDYGHLEELYRENSEYKKIVEHGLPEFDLCTAMFSQNTAAAFSQSPLIVSPDEYYSSPQPAQTFAGQPASGRQVRRVTWKAHETEIPRQTPTLKARGRPELQEDCLGAMDGTLVPAWVPRVDQNRYRSRSGRLAQNVLAICDFDMNFTYVYTGWEGSAVDAHVLDHVVSQDPTFFSHRSWRMPSYLLNHQVDIVIACCTLHNFIRRFSNDDIIFNELDGDTSQDMDSFYNRGHPTMSEIEEHRTLRDSIAMQMHLESVGFPQDDHWTLNVEQRFMWMIVDDNTRVSIRDDEIAEAQMGHWARGLRRYFGYPYTRDQYDIETFAMVFTDRLRPHATRGHDDAHDVQSSNATHSPVRGGPDAPIVLSDSTVLPEQSHTHIARWDAVENVARSDGRPRLAQSRTVAERRSLDMDRGQIIFDISASSHTRVATQIVRETTQHTRADHRDSHHARATVLRATCPI
ncbi:UNVERIFIED_CONTAM: hypothetical protein Sradi_0696700 [Sesamum radiatum]|uniref:Myb/SANT-like domain-containing protein n=1 Tax=Sesamum radiatum TaxID=300843 RepID=A0AAW2VMJ0_SESRA